MPTRSCVAPPRLSEPVLNVANPAVPVVRSSESAGTVTLPRMVARPPAARFWPESSDQVPPGILLMSNVAPPRTLTVPLASEALPPSTSVPPPTVVGPV